MSITIHRVQDTDVERAFAVLQAAGHWLRNTGRRQRISATTFDCYLGWQTSQANYAVKSSGSIVGVFSLPRLPMDEWPEYELETSDTDPTVWWLRSLATHPDFRHQNVGGFAIESALRIIGAGQPLFLDCVSVFLPDYYAARGFRPVSRQVLIDGEARFDLTLMRHPNPVDTTAAF